MGIMSSIFGERPSAPQTGGFTVGAEIPKELAPYYKDILGKSQALYNDSVDQGYKPYTGPSLAEFSPEQQQAFTGIAGLQGQQAPVYQEAMGMTREAATPITTEEITEYMNPYQQAVVDIEKREATKQYQSQVQPQLAAKAAMTQPFGGSRQAILEGMAADTQQRLLGDIQAKGSAQAYQDSVNLLNQQRAQQGNAAGQLATLGSNQFKSQLGELGALQTIGEEKQQLSQQALNEAYGQYIKEQEYPFQQLGRYQSVVTGAPIQQSQYIPPTPPGPSVGQQLLGGAATMLGTYGAFGGQMPQLFGGAAAAKTGGGIGDLPVIKRQQNASVDDDALSLYKRMLVKRATSRDLQEKQKLSNINTNHPNYLRIRGDHNYSKTGYTGSKDPSAIRMGDDSLGPFKAIANQFKVIPDSGPYGPGFQAHLEQSLVPDSKLPVFKNLVNAETLAELQNTMEVPPNAETFMSYIPKKKDDDTGIGSLISNKAKDLYSNVKDKITSKMEEKASRDRLKYERLSSLNSPFNDRNRPLNLSEQEDVRPDSPGKQDIKKLLNKGDRIVGFGIDVVNKGNNWINKNLNRLKKVGEYYVLQPGDKSPLPDYKIRTDEEAREIFNKYNFGGRDVPISKKEQEEENKKIDTVDMRPGRNEGLIAKSEEIIKKASASEIKEVLAFDNTFIEDFYKGIGPKVDGVKNKGENLKTDSLIKIEKLASTFNNKKDIDKNIKISDNIVKKNDKKITTTNKENNLSLKDLDKRATILANNKKKLKKAQEADKPTKKIETDLDKAQDKYLAALKDRNDNLDGKEKLINQSKTESFWAFVARVGANISQGKPIAAAVADELPQAMKDRQKLIQAKSDLDDKKDDGSVSMAKAEMTIETADAAAIAARDKEERGYKSKAEIAAITARGKTYNMKLPNFENSEPIIDSSFNNISMKLNKEPAIKKYFLANSNIDGINSGNFDDIFKQFKNSSDIKNAVYSRAFSDTEPFKLDGERMTVDELYRKHFDAQWKEFTGTYRKNNLMGINIPFTSGIKN